MVALYTELDNKNLILSNNMSSEQKEKYKKLKR